MLNRNEDGFKFTVNTQTNHFITIQRKSTYRTQNLELMLILSNVLRTFENTNFDTNKIKKSLTIVLENNLSRLSIVFYSFDGSIVWVYFLYVHDKSFTF